MAAPPNPILARRLRTTRGRQGLSQTALSIRAGVNLSTVNGIERGRIGLPQASTTVRLADALGVTVEWLEGGQ